ncbi:uncharacterized protein LOC142986376 isoform X1 [Anticarsia gemmatalis]|uniref:uncharacterized protein LOC142986376 isoform X1 n=1 Tax=Anticarsia gemmatalis TaxID=129554 RepID=UPI003F75EF83
MLTVPHLKIFTVFSLFPLIIGRGSGNRIASVGIDQNVADGNQFIKRIFHGSERSERPGILMFTAPYKLCEGGCTGSDVEDLAMKFPLYIGKKGRTKYKEIYPRDHSIKHHNNTGAPFTKKLKNKPKAPCNLSVVVVTVTVHVTTPETTTTTKAALNCPVIPPGICWKQIKPKTSTSRTKSVNLKTGAYVPSEEIFRHVVFSIHKPKKHSHTSKPNLKSNSFKNKYGALHKNIQSDSSLSDYSYSDYLTYKKKKEQEISSSARSDGVVTATQTVLKDKESDLENYEDLSDSLLEDYDKQNITSDYYYEYSDYAL